MYLLVFVFLIIGVLGIYSQVLAIEAARLFANQTVVADNMIAWHQAALSLASNVINPSNPAINGTGCSLTSGLTTPGYCKTGTSVSPSAANAYVQASAAYTLNGQSYPQLAPGHSIGTYTWESLEFLQNGAYYVITYVRPATTSASNPPPGYISTYTTMLNITESDLYRQLQNTSLPPYTYGYVSTVGGVRQMNLPPIISGGVSIPVTYTVPSSIPSGSLAIISQPSLCNGC